MVSVFLNADWPFGAVYGYSSFLALFLERISCSFMLLISSSISSSVERGSELSSTFRLYILSKSADHRGAAKTKYLDKIPFN